MLELLVVISIIAVLAAILFPVFARARETARRSSCASNLAQIGAALNMYAQTYDGRFPVKNNEFAPVYPWVSNTEIFYCPSDSAERYWEMKQVKASPYATGVAELVPVRTYSSYVYRGGLNTDDRADAPIASEAQVWHHDCANVLYLGGSVRSIPEAAYKPVVEPTQKPVEKEPERAPGPPGTPPGPAPMPPPPPSTK